MRYDDRYGRTLALAERSRGTMWRVQLGALYVEWNVLTQMDHPRRVTGGVIEFGWDSMWLSSQRKLPPPCEICKRQVPVPCRTVENTMESGHWDYVCDMWLNPHKYE